MIPIQACAHSQWTHFRRPSESRNPEIVSVSCLWRNAAAATAAETESLCQRIQRSPGESRRTREHTRTESSCEQHVWRGEDMLRLRFGEVTSLCTRTSRTSRTTHWRLWQQTDRGLPQWIPNALWMHWSMHWMHHPFCLLTLIPQLLAVPWGPAQKSKSCSKSVKVLWIFWNPKRKLSWFAPWLSPTLQYSTALWLFGSLYTNFDIGVASSVSSTSRAVNRGCLKV